MPSSKQRGTPGWRFLTMLLLAASLFMVGCAPSEAELAVTAEQMADQIAEATLAAWPTVTAASTYTPLPTLTRQATLPPQPTLVEQLTYTPLPTYTPNPTLTPLPTATATWTPTTTPTPVPVTLAPTAVPQSAFTAVHVRIMSAQMAQLLDMYDGHCENPACTSYSYAIDCPVMFGILGQLENNVISQPGSPDPQIVNFHDRYRAIITAFRVHIDPYVVACQNAAPGEQPGFPRGPAFNHAYDQYALFTQLLSEMENYNP